MHHGSGIPCLLRAVVDQETSEAACVWRLCFDQVKCMRPYAIVMHTLGKGRDPTQQKKILEIGTATWRSQGVIKARATHPLRQRRDSDHRKVLSYY